MAIKINLIRSNEFKQGYVGFSYTTGFFGFFVPLFRGDFKYFGIMLLVTLISVAIAVVSFGFLFFIPIVVTLYFAFKYNEFYTKDLISKGFVPSTEEDYCALFIYNYINKHIDGVDFNKYIFKFEAQEKPKKIAYIIYLLLGPIFSTLSYLIFFSGVLGILGLSALSNNDDSYMPLSENNVEVKQETPSYSLPEVKYEEPKSEPNRNNYDYGDYNDLDVLDDVYNQVINYDNKEYLLNFSSEELALIRNTIYARHGYIFQKSKYRNYFGSKPWYTPTTTNQNIISIDEKRLAEIIKSYE